jgi:hypothetical protein
MSRKGRLDKRTVDFYCKMYPELSCNRIKNTLVGVKKRFGTLDAVTVDTVIMRGRV